MWNRIVPLLIVLSVALNVGVAGVWIAHASQGYRIGRDQPDEGGQGVWCPLHRSLGVTEKQWQRLEPGLIQFRRDSETLRQDNGRRRGELIDLIASSQPDGTAIAAKQEEIRLGQQQMQQLVIEHLLAEKEVLTVQQQGELFDMIRERSGCTGYDLLGGAPKRHDMAPYSTDGREP